MVEVSLLIGGASRPAGDGRSYQRCHPVTGAVVCAYRIVIAARRRVEVRVAAQVGLDVRVDPE